MRIAFTDFYSGYEQDLAYNPVTAYFVNTPHFEIVTPQANPDLIVCSTWGKTHTLFPDVPQIMWTAENLVAGQPWVRDPYTNWQGVDWAVSSNYREVIVDLPSHVKHYYVPYAGIHHDMDQIKLLHTKNLTKPKTKFCCLVSSAQGNTFGYNLRYDFFKHVNVSYKRVDSAGRGMNNVGYFAPRGDAYIDWIGDYKFMICPENSLGAGYITEKIFAAYAAGTIPIYWGDETNFKFIREAACLRYTNNQETLAKMMLLDQCPDVYKNYQHEELFQPLQEGEDDLLSRNRLRRVYDMIVAEIKS